MVFNVDTVLVLILYTLACARITRLLNADTITDWLRLALARRARNPDASEPERQRWATALYFVECPWCVGFWICLASAYVPTALLSWPAWVLIPVALAASHLIGVFAFATEPASIETEDQ